MAAIELANTWNFRLFCAEYVDFQRVADDLRLASSLYLRHSTESGDCIRREMHRGFDHARGSSKLAMAAASSSNICNTESILVTLSTRRTGASAFSSLSAPAFFTAWQ
jgi:hypothetical protein